MRSRWVRGRDAALSFPFVQDGTRLADVEGAEFDDPLAAKTEAVRQIRTMIADDVREVGTIWLSRRIDIALPDDTLVCRVAFTDAVKISDDPDSLP